jgi:hypothetical protein
VRFDEKVINFDFLLTHHTFLLFTLPKKPFLLQGNSHQAGGNLLETG